MKISVALATYNGEKFIEEQISSIINQTIPVDEIVISDDGSSDMTLKLIENYKQYSNIIVYTDNKNHGFIGNFEYALKKCTGDIIFLADQDDIWHPTKVENFISVFQEHPAALLVFSNGYFIGKHSEKIPGELIAIKELNQGLHKLKRETYLEQTISLPFVNGMTMCVSRELVEYAIPFPKRGALHDMWLLFYSLCLDECFYLNKKLVYYRLHGENAIGNSIYKGTIFDSLKRKIRKISTLRNHTEIFDSNYYYAKDLIQVLEKLNLNQTSSYFIAQRKLQIGEKEMDALNSNRFIGCFKLLKLFLTDIRYKKSGAKEFLFKLMIILLHQKKSI